MAVPYTFAGATSSIPLSQLDTNFASTITLGNTAIQLGNTVTTLNNMTLANVTISSGNVTITNVTVTTANVTVGNITTLTGTSATYTNIASGNVTITGGTLNNVAIGGTTAASGAFTTLSASGAFSLTGDQVQISEGGTGQTTANAAFNALAPSQTGNSGKYLKTDGTDTSWDAIDINTADITGTLPILNGGTGQTTANAAFNALAPSQTSQSGKYLKTDGTNASWDALDISTADITGTLPIANGGSGQTTANAALNAFLPSQTSQSGKYLKTDGTNASWDQLDISTADITGTLPVANGGTNATATPTAGAVAYGTGTAYAFTSAGSSGQVLTSGGAGAPTWSSLSSIGVTTFSAGTTGFTPSTATSGAVTLAGTLATTNGGTGLTSFTANRVFYASSTSAIGQSANLTFDGTTLTANALTTTSTVTINGGTANGVAYLNGSKVLTTGSALTYSSAGNLIIGSATDSGSKLQVGASVGSTSTPTAIELDGTYGTSTFNGLKFYLYKGASESYGLGLGGSADMQYWAGSSSTGVHRFFTNQTEQMRLTSTGLGIGTSSPSVKLDVFGRAKIDVGTYASGYALTLGAISETGRTYQIGMVTGGSLAIYDTTAAAQRVVLDSSGNLGIGTSSPVTKLDVRGNIYIQSNSGFALNLNPGVDTVNTKFGITFTTPTYAGGIAAIRAERVGATDAGQLLFYTSPNGDLPNLRATLDSSGNLGLGVTPSAWNSGWRALQIGALSNFVNNGSGNTTDVWHNGYVDTGGNVRYLTTAAASFYRLEGNTFKWFNAPSGTAGNAISFTQAMTLDASSRLGIKQTSPTVDLDVGANDNTVAALSVRYSTVPAYLSNSFDGTSGLTTLSVNSYNTSNGSASWSAFQNTGYGNAAVQIASNVGSADIRFLTAAAANTNPTERARITSGGKWLVNTTSTAFPGIELVRQTVATDEAISVWNDTTSGDGLFIKFYTDNGIGRGSIDYNRAGGLTRYNTTSDYRAKDIIGTVQNTGATIDALKVYEGVMKGATQSRPMMIAHEAQEVVPFCVSGVKDETNEDGTPKYQQMDHASLVPLLIAEIQSLRARVAQLEAK